jgi:hypothetical protein
LLPHATCAAYAPASYAGNREQGLASLMGYIEGGNEDETTAGAYYLLTIVHLFNKPHLSCFNLFTTS